MLGYTSAFYEKNEELKEIIEGFALAFFEGRRQPLSALTMHSLTVTSISPR
jgi:hypothetical protein